MTSITLEMLAHTLYNVNDFMKGENKMSQFTFRIPDDLHVKIRVLAAFRNVSQNDVLIQAAQELINRWEQKHGVLPLPPEDIE